MFGLCVKTLKDKNFAAKTKTKKNLKRLLISKDELLANAIWRTLALRGFIDDDHNLTASGEMLYAMVSALPGDLQEVALVACELVQYGKFPFEANSGYTGIPDAGDERVKRCMTLVSRIACLGSLEHQEIGYTGILSRTMLAHASTVDAVRQSLRDLLEVCLTTMLLNGDANRERPDFNELGLEYVYALLLPCQEPANLPNSLPLLLPLSSCLGIAVANHLTELAKQPSAVLGKAREALLQDEKQKFMYASDLPGSFQTAWQLWDAVSSRWCMACRGMS
jgi:hypothetical protein